MTFLNRGRPIFSRIGRPVAAVTGLPVAAPAPEGVTDDLSASTRLNRASLQRLKERLGPEAFGHLQRQRQVLGHPARSTMSDETTPDPLAQIEQILNDAYGHPPSSCLYAITDVVEAALDAKDAEIRGLREAQQSEARAALKNINRWRAEIRAAEAAIARVREIHPRESTGFRDVCGACFDERENQFTWPCPTIAALDRPEGPDACICEPGRKPTYGCRVHGWAATRDLPAVRAFAAEHDPRGCDCQAGIAEAGCPIHDRPEEPTCPT